MALSVTSFEEREWDSPTFLITKADGSWVEVHIDETDIDDIHIDAPGNTVPEGPEPKRGVKRKSLLAYDYRDKTPSGMLSPVGGIGGFI